MKRLINEFKTDGQLFPLLFAVFLVAASFITFVVLHG